MKSYLKLSAILSLTFLQACTTTENSSQTSAVGQLIIAEPLQIDPQKEFEITRFSDLINRAEITEEQRAKLHYERGLKYDGVGLRSLAYADFNRALRLKPDFADAYNFNGILLTQLQEFDQAYELFDSTLDLAPDHDYAYLNRGIALYYGSRPDLAVDDLKIFYQKDPSDAYRVLWLYLAEYDVDKTKALSELSLRVTNVPDDSWPKNIIHLYSGQISQDEFLQSLTVGVRSNKELTERLCEAYFYLGKYSQFYGDVNTAANFFKLAMGTNVYQFIEHRYAKLELAIIRADMQQKTQEK